MNDRSKVKRPKTWRRPNFLARLALALGSCGLLCLGNSTRAQEVRSQPEKQSNRYITPPDPERVFRLESESTLMERMAVEAPTRKNPLGLRYELVLPSYPPVPPPATVARVWEPLDEEVEPAYLCYGRLYFERINSERYGW